MRTQLRTHPHVQVCAKMAVHSPIADNEGGNKQLAAAAAVTPTATAAANYFHVYVFTKGILSCFCKDK